MYRLGDVAPVNPFPTLPSGGLTPAQIAPMLKPEQTEFLSAIVDETPEGKQKKIVCYGIGAAAGLALGVLVGKLVF